MDPAERTLSITRSALRLCCNLGWAPVAEVPLPTGRRLDVLALRPDGGFSAIEVKSCARDFLTDGKWGEYRDWCDRLYFAVDPDFPQGLLPADTGLILADGFEAAIMREAPLHPLAPARRKSVLHRFATLAATRLVVVQDPGARAAAWAALRVE
ncbi:MmcB family DNA repair protein [Humitalea sp. 24SJ18S-53]|uniref:MmcB family DNA repair protein n=1 Tax=Humitalea sp. 24SJ18S-53 TaxID=3422307 RepID=UPI003D664374